MRFGLRLPSFALGEQTATLREMGAYLRRAEDLGFESAMLIDHLLVAPPAYRVTWLEPMTLLAGLAGVTRSIRLGTLVLVLPFRDPVAFAKEWGTLDQLSGGRTILGVGVGWNR
ncbi:MAG TPA: LLM class flavin-dependent oxidoreductase, partial [Candidatus Limnocylindrales bacterium]|nr:LLM class flavin-dependent oxidoreductase [Candidatus Limnocylindrales bacterium]